MKHLLSRRALIAILLLGASIWLYRDLNPLSRHGVYYADTGAGSETLNIFQFYRDHQGTQIEGPEVTGTWLYVTYPDLDQDGLPEIVVKSQVSKTRQAIIKLNLADASKPPFEVLEHTLTVDYAPQGLHWP